MATLQRVFKGLDVAAFEAEVGNWLANSGVEADDPLSLDGKTLRGVHGQEIPGVHLVSAYASRAGAVLAQVAAPGKGEGKCSELRGSEQPAAFQEGIETSGPPGAKEGCQGHLAVGALP